MSHLASQVSAQITTPTTPNEATHTTVERLRRSEIYTTYQKAFTEATGLPLDLIAPDGRHSPFTGQSQESPFCKSLRGPTGCGACELAECCLLTQASGETRTMECFAGMLEAAVPVKVGKDVIAYLRTGQVLPKKSSEKQFLKVATWLAERGRSAEVAKLQPLFKSNQVVSPDQFQAITRLLEFFSRQLAAHANRLVLMQAQPEPKAVTKGKRYVIENLDDRLTLEDVARNAGVSTFYFCKLFKQSTGVTFTEFVNRCRVEKAKNLLKRPANRVTEIAYDVGFQSLSQFNRCFLKYEGQSPTAFRARAIPIDRAFA